MIALVIMIAALLAFFYLGIGVGVALTQREHYRNNIGGPPTLYWVLTVLLPFSTLSDLRLAAKIRRDYAREQHSGR